MTDYNNLRKIITGDIVIKCRLGNDIRRIPINQAPTYDELCLMMYRVFKSEIKNPENIVMKYTDNEGDLISLLNDIDIDHAISISNLVKVTIFDKTSLQHMPQLQLSLIEIRDSLNELIKTFDIKKEETVVNGEVEEMKQTRKLTPAELASFDTTTVKIDSIGEKSSVKELTTMSTKAPTNVPYYPPISQPQQQQPQSQYQQSAINHPLVNNSKQNIQTPIVSQQPQQHSNVPIYPPPTATPLQQHIQQFNASVPNYPSSPNYRPPQSNNGPGSQPQQSQTQKQQQQPLQQQQQPLQQQQQPLQQQQQPLQQQQQPPLQQQQQPPLQQQQQPLQQQLQQQQQFQQPRPMFYKASFSPPPYW